MSNDSLVDDVQNLLDKRSAVLGTAFKRDFKVKGGNVLKSLNDYFRIALCDLDINTMQERSVLRDDISVQAWFRYFESYVVPTLVRFTVVTG